MRTSKYKSKLFRCCVHLISKIVSIHALDMSTPDIKLSRNDNLIQLQIVNIYQMNRIHLNNAFYLNVFKASSLLILNVKRSNRKVNDLKKMHFC